MPTNYAFVTLLTSDAYLPGALALVAALTDTHSSLDNHSRIPFQTVCLVTPETVDVSSIKLLRKAFNVVVGVEVIQQLDTKGLKLLGRPDLYQVLTKLHIFRLTQYSKIIFLDADVLPIRPLSHLFTLPHEFSAVPDVGWPDIFNSGVLVFNPGEDKFAELMSLLKAKGSWDGGDQGILNEWRGDNWHRLSFIYNTTPTAIYTYAPAYERFGSQIAAVHFIGPNKPWNSLSYRPPFTKAPRNESSGDAHDFTSILDRWFDVYDRHYRHKPVLADKTFEVKRYSSAWEAPPSHPVIDPVTEPPSGPVLTLEELKRVAIEGLHAVTSLASNREGEGRYVTLPLEGRVGLMRPEEATEDSKLDEKTSGSGAPVTGTVSGSTGSGDAGIAGTSFSSTSSHLGYIDLEGTEGPNIRSADYGAIGHQRASLGTTDPGSFHVGNIGLESTGTGNSGPGFTSLESIGTPDFFNANLGRAAPGGAGVGITPIGSQGLGTTYSENLRPDSAGLGNTGLGSQGLEGTNFGNTASGTPGIGGTGPGVGSPGLGTSSPANANLENKTSTDITGTSLGDAGQHGQAGVPSTPPRKPQVLQPSQTPDPRSMPPSPRPRTIALPPTPTPHSWTDKPPSTPPKVPPFVPRQEPPHQGAPEEERRPPSPPLLLWNPAIEPPPTTAPVSMFPTQTYYPNAWDQAQTAPHLHQQEHAQLFYPPPTPDIPKPLVQQGHYRGVTGEGTSGAAPTPDPTKVKHIFPWENQHRSSPGRIFPSDVQSPLLTTPTRLKTAASAISPQTPLSPLRGLPTKLAYANTWDTIPGIQKYATLLRPPKSPFPPLAPPFDDSEWKKSRGRGDKTEVSSRDGDDEDSENESSPDDSDKDKTASVRTSRRSSIVSATELITGRKKQYRTRGVQTAPRDMRTRGVQVNTFLVRPPSSSKSKTRPYSPSPGDVVSAQPDLPLSTAMPSPVIESPRPLPALSRSNGQQIPSTPSPPPPPRAISSQVPSPLQPKIVPIIRAPSLAYRQVSNDSSLSPASSGPPASPAEMVRSQSPILPIRKGGRVWDPARGVDVFKRGSEEVLARFLKMGSWDDEVTRSPQ
ncbi:glycosyltransferase family 8 protein [Amanita muscaria Koide BX008]|uniref:glycogenin glucosyltransferase n=1 Tax=Amanita muscaria (strain Koide BX008) TaxID=946122 RepID=A0A0C2TW88_AMAMK|nr:glycosyltransferase family 8 protein [Amanita muscaria Koide BX008]